MPEAPSTDLRMKPRDLLFALIASLTIVAVTAITVSALVEPDTPKPVARVTTGDLRALADLGRAIQANPRSTPAERRTGDRLVAVAEAVEDGEVEIIPDTTAGPSAPAATVVTSTTTTTTTQPPPVTTAPLGSRANPAPWPGDTTPLTVP